MGLDFLGKRIYAKERGGDFVWGKGCDVMVKRIETPNGVIRYEVEYKRVKNINFRIKGDGVVYVSASKRVPEGYIREIILKNCRKFLEGIKKTGEAAERKRRGEAAAEGYFYYLGKKYNIEHMVSDRFEVEFSGESIIVFAPDEISAKNSLEDFAARLTEKVFTEVFEEICDMLTEENIPREIKISIKKMKSRWGSCTPKNKRISLNSALIKYPIGCLRYVVLHELAHFHHINHGRQFYRFVERYMSDYKKYEGILKKPYYEVTI